ncbi:Archaemetzincin-1 [Thelotrema lepadinum]|nr:Archaemetzincin-1 [Thelotrema lepadinum]
MRVPKAHYLALQESRPLQGPYKGAFPAPLVLPGDELAYDPKYPPQSYHAWLKEKERNVVKRHEGGRNVVYIVAPPKIEGELEEVMNDWATPKLPRKKSKASGSSPRHTTSPPKMNDIVDYLAAFYQGVPVKILRDEGKAKLTFAEWDDDESEDVQPLKSRKPGAKTKGKVTAASKIPSAIALKTSSEAIRIRVRERRNDIYSTQLNLNDLLDVAIEILPQDAYALLMLVEQDLYEDDDDDFACGRAYGGSRIGVVSMARYNPDADEVQGIDREHAWPASHCKSFVDEASNPEKKSSGKSSRKPETNKPDTMTESESDEDYPPPTALHTAVQSAVYERFSSDGMDSQTNRQGAETTLWLGRVCRTASHELGHCFGIDHCVYYACAMQGTASIQEDARQPPYLCPVDLTKVLHATEADMKLRYNALFEFCLKHPGSFFGPFQSWLGRRLAQVEGQLLGMRLMPEESEIEDEEGDHHNGGDNAEAQNSQIEVVDLTTPPKTVTERKRSGK